MDRLIFFIFYFFTQASWLVPFKLLYKISDFLAFAFYDLIKYRRKTVIGNLQRAFPEKSQAEIETLAKESYRNLSDILLESFKGATVPQTERMDRYKVLNPELIDRIFNEGKSVMVLAGHIGNWEWGCYTMGQSLKHGIVALYKPLNNKYIDGFMKQNRVSTGCTMESIKTTAEIFKKYVPQNKAIVLLADQNPSTIERAIWVDFFGKPIPCLHGPEFYARQYDMPVVYLHLDRVKRGFYEITCSILAEKPSELPASEITRLYMQALEKSILKKPENWLWSHRRWKNVRD